MQGCWIRGVIYCILWYLSIFCGFLVLCCPLLPLLFFNHRLYRRFIDVIFAIWEMYPVVLMELLFGTKIIVTGDRVRTTECSLLVMNHRTRLDWNFLWAAMFYAAEPQSHRMKFVLKAPLRHAPGPGWVMQMAGFLYIHRQWERDQKLLNNVLDYLSDIKYTYQVLIFPEGTDFNDRSLKKSNEFADSHHLERYTKVLHPKTTGFVFLANKMKENKQLDAVYDFSVGYPGSLPQSEMDVLRGIFPEEVHFHIKRYPTSEMPTSDAGLKEWVNDLWQQKEQTLADFYCHRRFTTHPTNGHAQSAINNSLLLALLFWTGLIAVTLYGLCTSLYMQVWALIHCSVFLLLSFTSEGIHQLEASWYKNQQVHDKH
ncbi:lysocardiolipin acyltransferase 1-like [Homalodisca vitripennis]|uniref:lysocardiolipin acyltransferase 1-like n=1 Tax=Homalodisca vitripennis TaxID=197043 RepID=UPI001EEC82D1|nr:lysocardiolipin acyltransferase 1-like [Homalodisca vitripennis]XP_046672360.1 lysocardiolipin acyltransferase 1-like [Homalodisca vitripennis]XP_046672361.1 lysocardiolipin acyltransferase 1-like [Homalodisca vitripennis]XP_046672362.1 lysocardiolipin acyltransferase 1-like [Homalodisca vitripennis]XP_046672363.1 lysocardiolipin acyltransferase 1-like [Homalodisca vitripennis]XP_046672364.1 lysocardiolipin acyltransferase 1-like [Homalodisca vitripennis]KAG8254542.1 Lysocardiolipin acyltr